MNEIKYIKGDATAPQTNSNKVIVHICNDIGGWGKGFVMAISAKWSEPETQYRQWFQSKQNFYLGEVQFVQVEKDIWIANIIAQRNINKDEKRNPPIRYESVKEGLSKVAVFAKENYATVHMPRIGCGLVGGKWELMEPIIVQELIEKEIEVTVYDF
jgi:O-acetyl-ADP-ribose deacetylase (regulator of RNase III)